MNQQYYLAGALHAGTGQADYVRGSSKNSDLFNKHLNKLERKIRWNVVGSGELKDLIIYSV